MKIHEYQAKELFKKYAVPTPEGQVATHPDEAVKIARGMGEFPVVVKAQIHAGGRGKGGGVKLAESMEAVRQCAEEILGMTLVTHQTGPQGRCVKKILVEQGLDIQSELYLSLVNDRAAEKIVIMASKAGGMDIEAVAAETPEQIVKVPINPLAGISSYHCRETAFNLQLPATLIKPFSGMLVNLYRLFVAYDCSLVEINPLVITQQDRLVALDAKINFDDNGLFRHP
ncbi:MAG: acetate--CoA ligase family protein, partial [Deltaproteobacteria bacterium]|nr:acetate--CoA ligase family protein [Deltaproteobacteria bacterium]